MACKRKHSKYSSIISSNYVLKGLAFEILGPWYKEAIDFINVIGNRLIAESFREDFPCHSTWKRCKHSEHFSRFRNIIGNFCIIKQKCYVIMFINIHLFRFYHFHSILQYFIIFIFLLISYSSLFFSALSFLCIFWPFIFDTLVLHFCPDSLFYYYILLFQITIFS
jgi:hypothetical protein